MRKDDLNVSDDLSVGRILSEKKYEGTGFISAKKEGFYTELNERVEAVTRIYSETGNFYNIFILCLWLRIIRRSNLGV